MNRFFNSMRWRLLLWHGAILCLVLAAFGYTAFFVAYNNRFQRIDAELRLRLGVVLENLRPSPGRLGPPGGPRPGPRQGPRRFESLDPDFLLPDEPNQVRLPPDQERLFDQRDSYPFYFVILSPRGQLLQQSEGAPAEVPAVGDVGAARDYFRNRGEFRELIMVNRRGLSVVVGRSIVADLVDMRQLGWLLVLAGGAVLVLGLAGGWWLSSRAIRPIAEISATAENIAEGNLADRIPVADTDSELGQLAQVLNTTFDRLHAAFTRQTQFTADASHELRTPVSVLLTQTQSALARDRSPQEYRETLEACQRAAQRLRRLTESLLVLARLDAGEPNRIRKPCRLDRVVEESVQLLRPLAAEHHITVQAALEPVSCVGDAEQLARAVTNLLGNAIHYNRPRGEVRLHLAADRNTATLIVNDTGQGIAPDDLSRLFERFYRADQARSSGRDQTGLGLAITKAIIEAHQGSIHVESMLGKGSTFTVRLPCITPGSTEKG